MEHRLRVITRSVDPLVVGNDQKVQWNDYNFKNVRFFKTEAQGVSTEVRPTDTSPFGHCHVFPNWDNESHVFPLLDNEAELMRTSSAQRVKFPLSDEVVKPKIYESLFCLLHHHLSGTDSLRHSQWGKGNPLSSPSQVEKKYAILRIYIGFTNLNFSLTSLTGKIIAWVSGGSVENQTRNTRLTSRAVGLLLNDFLTKLSPQSTTRRIKVLFTGPSKRFRAKLFSMIKRKAKRLNFSVICKEEGFRVSFNGCRLTRAKR
jgi:ribosomal protein S11